MSNRRRLPHETPVLRLHVVDEGETKHEHWKACIVGRHIQFSTEALESYCFADWQPLVYDMMLLAAATEFADKACKRPKYAWGRQLELDVPVHDASRWSAPAVADALASALDFLTGDRWQITFRERAQPLPGPKQRVLQIPSRISAVLPFSDGLDSRCVAAIMGRSLSDTLVRVRLGSARDASARAKRRPFAAIPYRVSVDTDEREPSGRARGFKFTLIAGIAAYLSNADRVIMPESGQGALGPVLVSVAYAYEDYRNHPQFTLRMSRLLKVLLGRQIGYEFPRLWSTKAETVKLALETESVADLVATRTCWQRSQQVAVDHKRRQCGICAACLLRRMSLHAAGVADDREAYVWEDLAASDFASAVAPALNPKLITESQREYAIAGVLHLDHLAQLNQSAVHKEALSHNVFHVAHALGHSEPDTQTSLNRMLAQHRTEWSGFRSSLGSASFLADWFDGGHS